MTWTLHPRAHDLTRNYDPVTRFDSLTVVERWPGITTWTVEGPADTLDVFTEGMGCILDKGSDQVAAGDWWQRERWIDPDTGQLMHRTSFVEDNLDGRIVYPDAAKVLTSTPSTYSRAYDTRTLSVESLILGYVRSNLADLATTDRRLASLLLPASLNRGGTATVNGRWDNLGTLVEDLAEAGRLRVRLVHDETTGTPRLALRIDPVLDVSADVRFAVGNGGTGIVTAFRDVTTAPTVTHAIIGGGGQLAARVVSIVADETAAAKWGRRERFVDQRQTTDAATMTAAGAKALAEGSTPAEAVVGVTDGPDVQYRHGGTSINPADGQYGVGYVVGIDLPGGVTADNVVREVTTTVTEDDDGTPTETVQIVVGTPGASATDTNTDRTVDGALRRIELIERNT